MKIISANCQYRPETKTYAASVVVMSDSRTHTGESIGQSPERAAHAALSEACNKFREELHRSLSVGVQINF